MKIAVWDTYVRRPEGRLMHFDVLVDETVTDRSLIQKYVKRYLVRKGIIGPVETARCEFCHIETVSQDVQSQINQHGYDILEMENCD